MRPAPHVTTRGHWGSIAATTVRSPAPVTGVGPRAKGVALEALRNGWEKKHAPWGNNGQVSASWQPAMHFRGLVLSHTNRLDHLSASIPKPTRTSQCGTERQLTGSSPTRL